MEDEIVPAVGTLEIILILIVVVLFGPKRIPEIVRQIGSAMAEIRRTSDSLMRELTTMEPSSLEVDQKNSVKEDEKPAKASKTRRKPKPLSMRQIKEAATKLGIDVKGKSEDEIRTEMMERIYSHQTDPYDLGEKAG